MDRLLSLALQVAEQTTQYFITNDRPNVAGLVLAGSADFKTELGQSDMFDQRLKAIVLLTVDVSYGEELMRRLSDSNVRRRCPGCVLALNLVQSCIRARLVCWAVSQTGCSSDRNQAFCMQAVRMASTRPSSCQRALSQTSSLYRWDSLEHCVRLSSVHHLI